MIVIPLYWPTLGPRDRDTLGYRHTLLSLDWPGHLPTFPAGNIPALRCTVCLPGALFPGQLPARFLGDRATSSSSEHLAVVVVLVLVERPRVDVESRINIGRNSRPPDATEAQPSSEVS